MDQVW